VARPVLGTLRFAVAGVLIGGLAYALSWPVLYDGFQGVDALWHWHLASWVASEFSGLPYWNRWDLSGVDYRNIYPVLPSWAAVAVSRLGGLDLFGGLQVVQFAITPLMALGVYAFCDWRLKKPLVGLAASFLFLINPLTWIETVDYTWFASQLGVIFFMPSLIALDWFFELWKSKDRSWRFRLAAGLFVGFSALTGAISSAAFTASPLVLVAYVLVAGRERWWQWLTGPVLLLGLATLGIELFWIGPFFGFISFTDQRSTALTFSPAQILIFPIRKLFELDPISAQLDVDRYSLTPAVWLPAIAGVVYAVRDPKARILAVLTGLAVLMLTNRLIYYPLSPIPFAGVFVDVLYRPAAIHLRFFAPMLGGLGLFALPPAVIAWAGRRFSWPERVPSAAGWLAVAIVLGIVYVSVGAFANRVVDWPHRLAYGPGFEGTYSAHGADIRDIWLRHVDVCRDPAPPTQACSSPALTDAFSVTELAAACDAGGGSERSDVAICRALGSRLDKPTWDPANDSLIASTVAWCQGRSDPVCSAHYDPTWQQFVDPSLWRPLAVGCFLSTCAENAALRATLGTTFPTPPQRLEVQGDVQSLAAAGHELTGGATATTVDVAGGRAEPSPALYQFVENSLLKQPGVQVKQELTAITGIDAVALGPNQAPQGADYEAMGWVKTSDGPPTSDTPLAYQNPNPSGLASQWEAGNAVLVVGASQKNSAEVYNSIFERSAATGMVPFARGWLVRAPSPYIDDYSASELARYGTIVLYGYRYHSRDAAWSHLASWVQAGGRLFVETGWQYVDPDWDSGNAPSLLPVSSVTWGPLNPSAPVVVAGASGAQVDPLFGAFAYQGGGWGASSSSPSSLRAGAEAVVEVGGRVVAARMSVGSGRVLWSGANLFAHADQAHSTSEDALIAAQFKWLLPDSGSAQVSITPAWSGNEAVSIPLAASAGRTLVLFKESLFPGWSASLVGADGSRLSVQLIDAEYDYMLVSLDSVPAGSHLDFVYRPPWSEVAWWISSIVCLVLIGAWLLWPRRVISALDYVTARSRGVFGGLWRRVSALGGEEG
jgi:hypothetical protein